MSRIDDEIISMPLRNLCGYLEDLHVMSDTIDLEQLRRRLEPAVDEIDRQLAAMRAALEKLVVAHMSSVCRGGPGSESDQSIDLIDAVSHGLAILAATAPEPKEATNG